LSHFKRLVEQAGHPRFVSGQDADALRVLSDRARGSRDLNEFRADWLGEGWTEKFHDLAAIWEYSEAQTYALHGRGDHRLSLDLVGNHGEILLGSRCVTPGLHIERPDATVGLHLASVINRAGRCE
jgi:hypothetical protein